MSSTTRLGGWPDCGNLIASGAADIGGGSDTILEIVVGPNTTPRNWLMGLVDCPHLQKHLFRPSFNQSGTL